MKKKAQMDIGMSMIMGLFVIILIGAIFVPIIAQSVGESVNTFEVANNSIDTVVDNTPQFLTGFRAISDIVVYNETGGIVQSSNYTVTNNVVNNGVLTVNFTPGTVPAPYQYAWKISGTAQPTTYITDGGARAMANLIIIMFALAVLVAAIMPVIASKFE